MSLEVPEHLKHVEDDGPSTWAERRDLKPRDQKLRKAGCKIERRPKGKEPTWSHRVHGTRLQSEMEKILFPEKQP